MERMTELVTALRCARDCYSFPEDTLHVLEQWAASGDLIGTLLDELPESPRKAFSGIGAATSRPVRLLTNATESLGGTRRPVIPGPSRQPTSSCSWWLLHGGSRGRLS